jgi:predicted nucleotidyltransferase
MKKKFKLEIDFIDFLRLCNEHQVKYLVVGGYAVSIHGYPRYTKDLDVCIESSEENAEKMVDVINDFGLGSLKLAKEDFLKKNFITQLGYEPLRIDILNEVDGVSFSVAWQNKREVVYEGLKINFIGYNELLVLKQLAGRSQDLTDIKKLEERNKNK